MSLKEIVSANEWDARCQLAALYRLIAYYRMTDLIDTHISLRVPDENGHFLINHYGIPFEKMKASDLVKIDGEGNIVEHYDAGKTVNVAGFVIHSALHAARPDVHRASVLKLQFHLRYEYESHSERRDERHAMLNE